MCAVDWLLPLLPYLDRTTFSKRVQTAIAIDENIAWSPGDIPTA